MLTKLKQQSGSDIYDSNESDQVSIAENLEHHYHQDEDALLIWLDSGNKTDENSRIKLKLQTITHNLQAFSDAETCEAYINSIELQPIFLIVSSQLDEHILPSIHP
ncbi:unnamed protein product [Didymodactylos carnosus]|uniref:Uncharacterized protein n=1 Tax=Didymodactylos carnosus TaxID=1234261 RepID=A0A815D9G5_9BILA|nr:unnamed protein product [Didymodactylos carnosus]CAF1294252.1 unnamed protein product [Didymodactylos carnosus]CAF3810672.1 unnamed protein product [Didymodactylos carnosus]CAF4105793.1 unnamed protein product [Didymodactylos carnosus]